MVLLVGPVEVASPWPPRKRRPRPARPRVPPPSLGPVLRLRLHLRRDRERAVLVPPVAAPNHPSRPTSSGLPRPRPPHRPPPRRRLPIPAKRIVKTRILWRSTLPLPRRRRLLLRLPRIRRRRRRSSSSSPPESPSRRTAATLTISLATKMKMRTLSSPRLSVRPVRPRMPRPPRISSPNRRRSRPQPVGARSFRMITTMTMAWTLMIRRRKMCMGRWTFISTRLAMRTPRPVLVRRRRRSARSSSRRPPWTIAVSSSLKRFG
mmetsp:Transcript_410/g.966  ORF Transcript_410/g.966 Transcript_410/m.966 type:complete len:263 (-) Transcript_410:210-998(-)